MRTPASSPRLRKRPYAKNGYGQTTCRERKRERTRRGIHSKFRRKLRKQRLRTIDQRKGRKTRHEKGKTDSRHRERRVSAPSSHLMPRALSPRLGNGSEFARK